MKISLIAKAVSSASIKSLPKVEGKKERKITVKLDRKLFGNQKKSNVFRASYTAVISVEGAAQVEITYNFDFECDVDFSQEVAESDAVNVKAPTYAYPYIKSYAENLISMSGLGSYTLPYFDFFESQLE
ncbi:hypothetical protein [Pantoea sp. A4]|uniref:hypothetical protein n=1 Tax=Pantoea sp. A4 TaxID=1225184 RepID=UPI00037B3FD2|nr:hypothetical protein [Pantoea sp. A4]